LADADVIVRMRASDAIEKISLVLLEYLWTFKGFLIEQAATSNQKEVRWHLAQILPKLKLNLNQEERQRVVDILLSYFSDGSSIVITFAMQALVILPSRVRIIVLQFWLTCVNLPLLVCLQ
jgi:hypothetical protein